MTSCRFCSREPVGDYALTALKGEPDDPIFWRRGVVPLCERCHTALAKAGDEGLTLKATGERWWLGHGKGKFAVPG